MTDETEIRVSGLTETAKERIIKVVEEEQGTLLHCGNPTTSLEELFLRIIEESEARPGCVTLKK